MKAYVNIQNEQEIDVLIKNLKNKKATIITSIDELKKSIDENNTLNVNEICMEKEQLAKHIFCRYL